VFEDIPNIRTGLGESPLWDGQAGTLYWIDCLVGEVHACHLSTDARHVWKLSSSVGSIGLAHNNHLILALKEGFALLDLNSGVEVPISSPEAGNSAVRFNDGKMDRAGRFLAGTMRTQDVTPPPGILYALDGERCVSVLQKEIQLTNGVCFSPDGNWLYYSDTLAHSIYKCSYDLRTGSVGPRQTFFNTKAFGSMPDGATVDTDGCLWIALVQSHQIVKVTAAGQVEQLIDLPVLYPSSVAFGGDDMRTIFITSISDSGGVIQSDDPRAGVVLAMHGTGSQGIQETCWAGLTEASEQV
jgi:sugar lactone lactonase YvrE